MADASVWSCQTDAESPLTVGQKFSLECGGEPLAWDRAKVRLEAPKKTPFALHILKVNEITGSKASFVATTYMAPEKGQLPIQGFVLSDGTRTMTLAPFQLQVKSVITPEKNPERKPFGAIDPMKIDYPFWLWLAIGLILVSLLSWIVNAFIKSRQRKQFLSELEKRSTTLTPYNQFNKDLRTLSRLLIVTPTAPWQVERAQEFLKGLQESFNWYLAREYRIPAQKWSRSEVLSSLKKVSGPKFTKFEKELHLAFREMDTAGRATAKVAPFDAAQLMELSRRAIEKIQKERS